MSKTLIKIIEKNKRAQIQKHMPAKDVVEQSDDERTALERFETAYDQAWIEQRDQSRNVEDDGFHPSSLGIAVGKCGRRNVYLLRGIAKKSNVDARTLRVFANGHDVHARIQKTLENMGIDAVSEIPIDWSDPPIKGHADGTLVWEEESLLIEIKSCSEDVFLNRLKWKKPKDEHFDQANIYAYILGLEKIWIIYECKNNQETKIFEKKANPEAAEKIINKWREQYKMYEEGKLPKRPYKPGSPTCAGCDLAYHCLADPEVGE